jgi:hypothetical protein
MGWAFKMKSIHGLPSHQPCLSAERGQWRGVPVVSMEYGYISPSLSEGDITRTAQRLVTLCETIDKVFVDSAPQLNVDKYGILKEDPGLGMAASKKGAAALHYIREHYLDKSPEQGISINNGFLIWMNGKVPWYINKDDVKYITSHLTKIGV